MTESKKKDNPPGKVSIDWNIVGLRNREGKLLLPAHKNLKSIPLLNPIRFRQCDIGEERIDCASTSNVYTHKPYYPLNCRKLTVWCEFFFKSVRYFFWVSQTKGLIN